MNLKKLGIVIQREYYNKVRKKSFLLITFGVPILFALMYVLLIFIMLKAKDEAKTVAVIDESGIVMPYLENSDVLSFIELKDVVPDSVKNNLKTFGADMLLSISPLDSVAKTVNATTYSEKPIGVESIEMMEHRINKAVESYRIDSYGIEGLQQIMSDVKSNVSLRSYTVDEAGNEKISQSEVYMIISMVLGMAIYMFIALFCGMVMTSVIEEKSSRVVEVLVSSVKATELMFGKIIGVALVALTQFLLWIVLTGAIVGIIGTAVGFDKIMGDDGKAAAEAMMSNNPMGGDILGDAQAVPGMTIDLQALTDTTAAQGELSGPEAILGTIRNMNMGKIIIAFLLFFVFGYLLYASLFAAIGSAVENEADTQQLQLPVTIPLLLGFFVAFYAFRAPDSPIVFWCSMIPFTSPIVMLARIPFGVPTWELVLSIAILVLSVVAVAWISAKIYKVGILMYGKKSSFKDLWKWLKQK